MPNADNVWSLLASITEQYLPMTVEANQEVTGRRRDGVIDIIFGVMRNHWPL